MSQIAKFDRQAMNQQLKRCGQLLKELQFIDMYIRLDQKDEARVNMTNPANGRLENLAVPECFGEEVEILREMLRETTKDDYSLTFEEMRLRVARRRMANGEQWAAMRRVADSDLSMESLKFDPNLIPYFSKMGARDGLILIAGATGHGKTTTANCLLSHYLKQYGKVAYTVEDPAEYNLHGKHGDNGYCFQTEVDDEHGWADALKSALRWHPKYILVGEIRSPDAAAQVLRAATSGHLVITTVHAGSVEKTLHGMIQISSQALGDRAAQLLGDGLSCVIHQTLGATGPQMKTLFTNPRRSGDGIRSHIREQKIHMLSTEMDQQAARLAQGVPLFSAPPRRVS
ncbi:MAG: Flp pilus assembly complex ATPase component TadA [Alphaproteobacteria bacterium]|nr:Flp pilus assembly complex ATPase component TadA [Alphaproteobacteria bacterium SS10]